MRSMSFFIINTITSTAQTMLEITVASATPATLMSHAATNKKLSPTLSTPVIKSVISARLVSPTLRKIAAPKSNTIKNGMPTK